MLLSLARRIILFLSSVFLLSFSLIYTHTLHEGTDFPWPILALGAGAALLALVINWIAVVKTDDYLIPTHARAFLAVTAALAGILTISALAYFLFTDDYPDTYFLYFGLLPTVIAIVYVIVAGIRMKEVYLLPPEYRADADPKLLGLVPVSAGTLAVILAIGALAVSLRHLAFESRFDGSVQERMVSSSVVDIEARATRAAEVFQLAKAQQAENRYRHAHELFQEAAALDHPEADFELALIYSGDGYLQNPALAHRHLQEARRKGHVEAAFLLGRAYRHGELRLEIDYVQARENLTFAASAGHTEAAVELGHIFNRGQGTEPSPEQAFYWFKKAAEKGHAVAQNDVGIFYVQGNGVERNPEEGLRWLTLAAEQGATVAEYNLGRVLYEGELVPQDYERAFLYFTRLAEKNVPYGFRKQGLQYFYGQGVAQDYELAAKAFSKGTTRRDAISQYYLGYCYLHGHGVARDTAAALNHLEAAAKNGNVDGQLLLARLYLDGTVILEDRPGAATWLKIAAENGSEAAAEEFAELEATLTVEEADDFASRYLALQQQKRS